MDYLLGGAGGFLLAMLLFERQRLMVWMKTVGAWIQKVTKKR